MKRRIFLKSAAAAALVAPFALSATEGSAAAPVPAKRRALKKAFMLATLNSETSKQLTVREKFDLLRGAGFDGVEVMSAMDQEEVLAARDANRLEIPSVVIATHWTKPLTDPDPAVRAVGLEGLKQGLRDAQVYGARSVLLVPGTVTKTVSYEDAYARATAEIAKALPLAESLGVAIAIENVWNRFLLSPLEAAQFVDSFKSPMARWHFDVGNVANTSWPEHWIRTLGRRIAQVHIKEYSRKARDEKGPWAGFRVDLFEGDNDWPEVMRALDEIDYSGWLITEQFRPEGFTDATWLAHLSKKLDQIIAC